MKTIYILYCALIALATFSTPASADCNIVGDANNDNRITAADSVLTLQMSVGSVAPDLESADVSGDGRVSSLDALMILTMAQKTQVGVTAPEVVLDTFNVTIDAYNVADLDSGQFDLSFDPSVVNVTAVYDGNIDGTTVPIDSWNFTDADTIRVLFNLPGAGATGISGSGQIATISFEITGSQSDTCVLDISDGLLVDTVANETPALWFDADVAIGVSVTVDAPEVATDSFNATIDITNVVDMNGGQFDLSFDSSVVNVTDVYDGNMDGTTVPISYWRFMDADTIRVTFKLSGDDGVSGSGYVTKIGFETTGSGTSVLDIFDGKLADTSADEIPATWIDDEVTV